MNLAVISKYLTLAGLIAIMLSMGLKVRVEDIIASFRSVGLVLRGLVANFVLVPLATVGLLFLFDAHPMVSLGFFILAISPGAPMGPLFSAIAKADVPTAISQMVILAAISTIVSPSLLSLLAARLLPESHLHIEYLSIIVTLAVSQILPLATGLSVHYWAPHLTGRFAKPFGVFANVLLVGAVTLILIREYEALETIRLRGWIGMLMLLAASLGIGWLCGGPRQETRKTLAITTGVRNVALGLAIATSNFAGTPAVTAVLAYTVVSVGGALCAAIVLSAFSVKAA